MSASAPNEPDHELPLVLDWPIFAISMHMGNSELFVAVVLFRLFDPNGNPMLHTREIRISTMDFHMLVHYTSECLVEPFKPLRRHGRTALEPSESFAVVPRSPQNMLTGVLLMFIPSLQGILKCHAVERWHLFRRGVRDCGQIGNIVGCWMFVAHVTRYKAARAGRPTLRLSYPLRCIMVSATFHTATSGDEHQPVI